MLPIKSLGLRDTVTLLFDLDLKSAPLVIRNTNFGLAGAFRENERTNEVYLPMNKRVDNGRLPVEAEDIKAGRQQKN